MSQEAFRLEGMEQDLGSEQTPAQMERAAQWGRLTATGKALCADFDGFLMLQIPGNPVGKSRARFDRHGHAYKDSEYRAREEWTRSHMRSDRAPEDGNLVLICAFYRSTYQRIDVDNMLKHVCDCANGVLWRDDSQVKAVAGFIDHDKENPRTILMLGRTSLGMARPSEKNRKCEACGKSFRASLPGRRFCSRECASPCGQIHHREERKCFTCGSVFKERETGQRYCSRECALSDVNRNKKKRPKSECRFCGKPVSRPEYTRCRACWTRPASDETAASETPTGFDRYLAEQMKNPEFAEEFKKARAAAAAANTLEGLKRLGAPKRRPRLVSSVRRPA